MAARATHRGSDIKALRGPSIGAKYPEPQVVDARLWRWRVVISSRFLTQGEPNNILEARALNLALRLRLRSASTIDSKILHLLDSGVVMGGRSQGAAVVDAVASNLHAQLSALVGRGAPAYFSFYPVASKSG